MNGTAIATVAPETMLTRNGISQGAIIHQASAGAA